MLGLDILSGETKPLHEDSFGPSQLSLAVSADGRRIAAAGSSGEPGQLQEGMFVSDHFQTWELVTPLDDRVRIRPQWSPDATALAFLSLEPAHHLDLIPMQALVVSVPRPARPGEETILTSEGGRSIDVAWAADGRCLYHAVHRPDSAESYLEAVEWPSLERRTIMTGGHVGLLSVAGETGDVVWMEEEGIPDTPSAKQAGQARVFWRQSPNGRVERTPVRPDRPPFIAVVSPDGKRLAVVWRHENRGLDPWGRGLVVYSLADGSAHPYPEFDQVEIISAAWALDGGALLVAERGKSIWLVQID